VGKTEDHGVAVGDEDITHAVGARAGREQRKAAPEERMGGIGDLDFRQGVSWWVVDRGIKVFGRSTISTIRPYYKSSTPLRASIDASRHGSKPEPSIKPDSKRQKQEHHKGA